MKILMKLYRRRRTKAIILTVTILVLAGLYAVCSSKKSDAWEFSMSNLIKEKHVPKVIHRLHVEKYINAVAWNADGSRLAVLSNFGGTITVWETIKWTILKEIHRYGGAYSNNSLAFLPDGTLLTSAPIGDYSDDPRYANTPLTDPRYKSLEIFSLIRWNIETGKPINYIPDLGYPPKDHSPKVTDVFAVSKDGSLVAAVGVSGVFLYETRSWSLLRKLEIPHLSTRGDGASSVAFSPDGNELAVGTRSGKVHYFNLRNGSIRLSFTAYEEATLCEDIKFSPDGRFLATGRGLTNTDENGLVRIWRVGDGKMLTALTGGAGPVRTLSWNPNSDVLVAGDDKSLRLWQVGESAQKTQLIKKIFANVFSTAYSSQGILAASNSNEIIILQ